MYERDIRGLLSKLERLTALIPDEAQRLKSTSDLESFTLQFQTLVFEEEQDELKRERDFKKLLTVAKSKFYMLRVNYPKAFETVDSEAVDSFKSEEADYDPLADKSGRAEKQFSSQPESAVDLDEEEGEGNRRKRAEVIAKDQLRSKALDEETANLIKHLAPLKEMDAMNEEMNKQYQRRDISYVHREENEELKHLFEEEQKKF